MSVLSRSVVILFHLFIYTRVAYTVDILMYNRAVPGKFLFDHMEINRHNLALAQAVLVPFSQHVRIR